MNHNDVNFCVRCGNGLETRERSGAKRPVCTRCDYTHFFDPKVAAAMWLTQNNMLLLVRRAIEPAKGLWTIPGGFVDAWENPAETASRECNEETGLRVIEAKLLDLVPSQNQSSRAGFVIFYTGQIISGDLKAGDDADAADWFYVNQLPEIAFDATQTMINRWKNGLLVY
ncbi:MAG: hypothetical protein CL606_02385 [Anaerolineaceae bacterium]|nr:hypothetical protein [Anaerolineaceae bacterium]|tara:strand:- start:671 stop:1180 length:510 start_codon:yes stop_codon:yes gene_type:complete